MDSSAPGSVAPTEDEDFDLNAETMDDEPAPEDDGPQDSIETEDEAEEDITEDVSPCSKI